LGHDGNTVDPWAWVTGAEYVQYSSTTTPLIFYYLSIQVLQQIRSFNSNHIHITFVNTYILHISLDNNVDAAV
jgi:hypothetical protein